MTRVTGTKNPNHSVRLHLSEKNLSFETKKASCIVLLSIRNNKYCKDKWLKAMTTGAVDNFKQVTFLIIDSLQKYNLAAEYPAYDDLALTNKLNEIMDEWWNANEPAFITLLFDELDSAEYRHCQDSLKSMMTYERITAINRLAVAKGRHFTIKPWLEWLATDADYLKDAEAIMAKYKSAPELKDALEKSISDFIDRRSHEEAVQSEQEALCKASANFLIEESPGLMIIGAKRYDCIAYPGKKFEIFAATQKYFCNNYKGELFWFDVNFKRVANTENSAASNNAEGKQEVAKASHNNALGFFPSCMSASADFNKPQDVPAAMIEIINQWFNEKKISPQQQKEIAMSLLASADQRLNRTSPVYDR